MKKIILCLTVLILLFSNCKKDCKKRNCKEDDPCKIDRPKDVKPIDWENYNSVYDVFWNYTVPWGKEITDWGKEIMACGWVSYSSDKLYKFFTLQSDTSLNKAVLPIFLYSYYFPNECEGLVDSLNSRFQSADLTKKCFIKGELNCIPAGNPCNSVMVMIVINSAKDIYFE